jgi:hypothetical protein
MEEVRPSKKRKTTKGSAVAKLVEQPWAGREEGEVTAPVSATRRDPPCETKKPIHIDSTTTPKGLPTAADPSPSTKSERTTKKKTPAKPRKSSSGKRLKGKAANGKSAIRAARVRRGSLLGGSMQAGCDAKGNEGLVTQLPPSVKGHTFEYGFDSTGEEEVD